MGGIKYEIGKLWGRPEFKYNKRRCAGFFTVDTAPLLCHREHIFDNYANTSDITIDGW